MVDSISSGLSGQAAASHRPEPKNDTNIDTRGSLPLSGEVRSSEAAPQAYQPVAVEQSNGAENETVATDRYERPPYVPVFDTTSRSANDESRVAEREAEVTEKRAEQKYASEQSEASQRTVESQSDLVRRTYDLPE